MKIFLGLNNNAGILSRLKKGFKEIGIEADFYTFEKHKYGYESDRIIVYSRNNIIRKFQKLFLILKLLLSYRYFIFDSGQSLLPGFRDIKIFRLFRKKCMMIFTGCDARIPEAVEQFKWNPCVYCTDSYKNYVGCVIERKKSTLADVENIFDILVSPEEAGGFLKKEYYITLFPVDADRMYSGNNAGKKDAQTIRILHAPSHEEYKGTKYIITAVDRLMKEMNTIDFKIVNNVPVETIYKELSECDILIDQMLVGFYGLISIEAMTMNKPVVCYIREDLWNKIKNDCPVFNANPDNLYDKLKWMVMNMQEVRTKAASGSDYVKKYHDAKVIAKKYLELFETH